MPTLRRTLVATAVLDDGLGAVPHGVPPGPIDFSVVLPLFDDRGRAIECVRSWATQQRYPRDRFELLVISGGSDRELEARILRELGGQGQLVRHESPLEPALYNRGARESRGRLVFITETHCVPAADCLAQMKSFLDREPFAGARCRSVPEPGSRWAWLESQLHEELFRETLKPGHWLKVLVHGTAIRREVFAAVGGMEEDLGKCAEWALAARLHDQGHAMGYCPEALVEHRYSGELNPMRSFERSFVFGDLRFRDRNDPAFCERYFGRIPGASELLASPPARARTIAAGVAQSIFRRAHRPDLYFFHLRMLLAWLDLRALARLGSRWPQRLASGRHYWTRSLLALAQPSPKLAYRLYVRHWARIVHHTRREHGIGALRKAPEPVRRIELAEWPDVQLHGFHAPEGDPGARFRWSGPVAWIGLTAPGTGAFRLSLHGLPVRMRLTPASPALFCGRSWLQRLPDGPDGTLRFAGHGEDLARAGGVTFVCRPVPRLRTRRGERRRLGIPLRSVTVETA